MVGYYKYISKFGNEEEVNIDILESDKDVYNFFHKEEKKNCKNIDVYNIDYTPIYQKELLEYFNYIKKTIEKEIKDGLAVEEIKTTTILKNNERLEELQKLFGLQQFKCNEEYILVPASDFGVFSLYEDVNLKRDQLPIRLYEFAKCYRIEEKKKHSLKRPTTFNLPDIHCFIDKNVYEEVQKHLVIYSKILKILEIPFFVSLRISEKEYQEKKEIIRNIAKELEEDIIVNIVPNSIKYWESKFKYIYKDSKNEYIQLSTVQVDYKTSNIFKIKMEGKNIKIVHSSIGSMERLLHSYLDK